MSVRHSVHHPKRPGSGAKVNLGGQEQRTVGDSSTALVPRESGCAPRDRPRVRDGDFRRRAGHEDRHAGREGHQLGDQLPRRDRQGEAPATEGARRPSLHAQDGDERAEHSSHAERAGGDGYGWVGPAVAEVRFVSRLREGGAGAVHGLQAFLPQ